MGEMTAKKKTRNNHNSKHINSRLSTSSLGFGSFFFKVPNL